MPVIIPGPPFVLARPWASLGQSTVSDPGAPDRRADLKINNEPPDYRARPGPAAWAGRRRRSRTTQVSDAFRGSGPQAGRRRPNRMSSRGRRFTGQRGEGGGKARTRTSESEASCLAPWQPHPQGTGRALPRCWHAALQRGPATFEFATDSLLLAREEVAGRGSAAPAGGGHGHFERQRRPGRLLVTISIGQSQGYSEIESECQGRIGRQDAGQRLGTVVTETFGM